MKCNRKTEEGTIIGDRLGSMFFLAMLVALRIMPLYAEEVTIKATAAWVVEYASKLQGDSVEAAAVGVAEWPALKYKLS